MAFYKRRVVVEDTPTIVSERHARACARDQINAELASRYPDMGTRAYSVDEMRGALEWQAARFEELVAENLRNPGCVNCAPGSCTDRCVY